MDRYITMNAKETERISVMGDLKEKRIKQKQAARVLGITPRQARRVFSRYKREGAAGLVHKSRGRVSNRAIAQEEKDQVIELIKKYYPDFGPTFAHEKLVENHGVKFSISTVRKEMIKQGLWQPKERRLKETYPYRQRRACLGEMEQLDGSPHAWFEDRAEECTLITFIDDATSRIMDGMFVDYEGTFTFFAATRNYLERIGKPLSLYVDKHSTFKVNRQATIEEKLRDAQAQSQFSRAMEELNIEIIFAYSPQAKGRVERLFETLQDRLVKEMRLEGISSKQEGTRYFREIYIPKHNNKFAVAPREAANLHRPLLPQDDLDRIFTVRSQRKTSKDYVVRYRNKRYQLKPPKGYRYSLRKAKIIVAENNKGKVSFLYKDKEIPFTISKVQPRKKQVASSKSFKEKRVYIPSHDHPWRQSYK